MSDSRFALLDPTAGISGDMLLGALVSAGASAAWLQGLPERLGLAGVTVSLTPEDRCGIRAVKATVRAPGGEVEDGVGRGDHHAGPHRHLGELLNLVRQAPISPWVKERALRAFELLGEAEGHVHGVAPERVALHEVGALDALVDIVGGVEGFEQLGIERVFTRPVALGNGWVRAAHGLLPVPAPATALLLEGLPIAPAGPVEGEATTPTGAALLRVLTGGPPPASWRPLRSGWGAGTRNPAAYPNALRLILGEAAIEATDVTLLTTDLDDMSPEYLGPLREALVAAGALDVQTWPTQMKKGRIGFRVEAVVPAGREDAVAEALFRESTTAGLRLVHAERRTLARRQVAVTTRDGAAVRVKVLDGPAGSRVKPEFDDVHDAARASGRPMLDVAAEAGRLAQDLTEPRHDPICKPKESA